jgi:hypothetical protein
VLTFAGLWARVLHCAVHRAERAEWHGSGIYLARFAIGPVQQGHLATSVLRYLLEVFMLPAVSYLNGDASAGMFSRRHSCCGCQMQC